MSPLVGEVREHPIYGPVRCTEISEAGNVRWTAADRSKSVAYGSHGPEAWLSWPIVTPAAPQGETTPDV